MGWIGVDLDGTLAEYHGWYDGVIGPPVPAMVARVQRWLAEGRHVRILTARVAIVPEAFSAESQHNASPEFAAQQELNIKAWCLKHIGCILPVTAQKDFACVEMWDDRAVQVEPNTGRRIDGQEDV